MKPLAASGHYPGQSRPLPSRQRGGGVALVLVLAFLVIITALVIAFFTTVTTELSGAKGYEGEAVARQLGDSAVQNVMAAITQATNHPAGTAWASQPGMIWNYDATGGAASAYKLYSSDNMVATGSFTAVTDVADNWWNFPSVFTDLNSPVTTASGTLDFPIIDGNAMRSMSVDGSPALTYSTDGSTQDVAGFSVNAPSTKSQNLTGTSPSPTNNPVPMPTRWLYVLKSGALIAADAGTNEPARFTKSPQQPSSTNPIVGRFAYWTDDETCKVNINTASEGNYWDTPRGASYGDQILALYQPAQQEFQRYPGHPATVSLSTVFPLLTADQIFSMAPRVVSGGSRQGTAVAGGKLPIDSDRLYASVDELMFNSLRGGNPAADPSNPSKTDTFALTKTQLDQKKFFLTARSVAPELNLYDLPRIACWPLYSLTNQATLDPASLDPGYTTAYDRWIATCATTNCTTPSGSTGFAPYFFQRKDSLSATTDIGIARNQQLLSYLRFLTSKDIPGFGGKFSTKYGADCQQILTEIFDYIRCTNLFDDVLVAAGGIPFTTIDATQSIPNRQTKYVKGHGFVAPARTNAGGVQTMGFGRCFTIEQFGVAFICNAVARSSATSTVDDSYGSNDPATNQVLTTCNAGHALNPGEKVVQAFIPMEFFSPMEGWAAIFPDMTVEVSGLDQLYITDPANSKQNLGFPAVASFTCNFNPIYQNAGEAWGGPMNWRYTFYGQSNYPLISKPIKITAPNNDLTARMGFTGADITVKIYIPANSGNLVQTLTIPLPNALPTGIPASYFPIPNLVTTGTVDTSATGGFAATPKENWWSLLPGTGYTGMNGRLFYSKYSCWGLIGQSAYPCAGAVFRCNEFTPNTSISTPVLNNFDVVRTVLPKHGDFRLVAGSYNVPNTVFGKHRYYDPKPDGTTVYAATNLSNSTATAAEQGNDTGGRYFSGVAPGFAPDMPTDVNRAISPPQSPDTSGDVDSGLPNSVDGPFVNKPDEGNVPIPASTDLAYYTNYYTQTDPGPTFFSPNRIMVSPGMFGSLPTGLLANKPWQTLLFRRQDSHPQSNINNSHAPSDHLMMDLFWMPVVEPYAISDRFSTAGKININYQIAPFSYITRNTALRAVFKGESLAAIANAYCSTFRGSTKQRTDNMYTAGDNTHPTIRLPIDAAATLSQFQNGYFVNGKLFRSASEICDLYIVPTSAAVGANAPLSTLNQAMTTFWNGNLPTGDNLRERIYTTLYPRLTTKSNTFTVHFRAQALKQSPVSASAGTWSETKDAITGDYRGSTVIERYLDPSDPRLSNYAPTDLSDPTAVSPTLTSLYRWRVVENHRFAP